MFVKKLIWLSEPSKEAELVVTDGVFECVVFSCPCDVAEGEMLHEPLRTDGVDDLMISRHEKCFFSLVRENGLEEFCVAEVVDPEEGLVKVGNIEILLGCKAPSGAVKGDLVEFTCRLDVW